jgi:hypothetical protein
VPFGHNLDGPTVAHHIRLHHWRQIDDAYARKLLTYRHQLVASDLSAGFSADYGYVLAVYWRYAPLFALQQLLVVVIVWVHGAIGLYSTLVLRRSWPRLAPIVVPITLRDSDPCAVGICACRRGRSGAPCDRYCVAGPDRAELQSRLDMGHRLSVIQRGVFLVYGRRLGSGHTHPQHAETAAHTRHSILRWRPHRGWTRRGVGARGQPSERRSSCEHLRRPRPLRNVQDHRAGRH